MSETASLRELVDLNELQAIQDSFAKTVGTSSVILSPEGEPLTQFSNPIGFCTLIQSTEEGKRRCFLSFMEMSQKALESEEPVISYCFAHGGHFVAPIIIDGEHKGTMFAGQFIPQKLSLEQLKALEKMAVEINVDPYLLVEEAKKMRVVEEDAVRNYSSLLLQIVAVITRLGAQADELNHAKNALQKVHNELEIRVQERTAELAIANEELKQEIRERKKAEETLSESEIRFKELFNNMSSGVAVYEAKEGGNDFVFTDFNQAAEKRGGIKKEDLLGKSVLEVFPGAMDFGLFDVFQRVWNTGKPQHHPISFYKDERIVGWTENYVYKLPSGEIVAVYDDVTERKQAEEALRESEEKYRIFIERTSEGYWVLDSEHKTVEVNQSLCDMLEYKKEEMMGKSPHDFVDEENLKIFKYQMGKIESTLHRSYEIVLKNKNGEDVFTRFNATTIRDDTGVFKGAYALVTNITEQKKAEEALRESNAKIHAIVETAKDSIFIKDQKLKYVMVNPAMERLFGMPAEELLGKSDTELFGEEAEKHIEEVDRRVLQGELVDEFPSKPVGGETKTFHTIKVPLHDASGAIIGLCGIARDITEQKQIEEELRESLTKLKRFNKLAVGRELRIIELKKAINALLEDLGKEPRYKIASE